MSKIESTHTHTHPHAHVHAHPTHTPPPPTPTPTPTQPNLNGPSDYSDLLPLVDNQFGAREEETEEEEVRSLADLSPSDTKYQTITISCNEQGQFGFTLRHFSIQPSNIPVSES